MAARRMPSRQHPPAEPLPKEYAGAADLLDDVGDGDVRTQIVADDRDGNAAPVQAARHVAVTNEGSNARQ